MPAFNRERAAAVLVDAAFRGDKRAAKRHGVTEQSVFLWRKRMATDKALLDIFNVMHKRACERWADGLAPAIVAATAFIQEAAAANHVDDPQKLQAVSEALRVVSDVKLTNEVLNARLAQLSNAPPADDRPMAASSEAGPDQPSQTD